MDQQINRIITTEPKSISQSDYDLLLEVTKTQTAGILDGEWLDLIMRVCSVISAKESLSKSVDFAEDTYLEFIRKQPNSFKGRKTLQEYICKGYIEQGNQKKAHEAMNKIVYISLAEISFGASNSKMRYFSFRPFSEYSLKDIKYETISLAHPREFNDPLDTILVYWLNKTVDNQDAIAAIDFKYSLLLKKVSENIKVRCLIGSKFQDEEGSHVRGVEDLPFLMWSHYAKSHTGFCVEYEFERSVFENGASEDKINLIEKVDYKENISIGNSPSFKTCLFDKSDFWNYEHEMRLVQFDATKPSKDENREYPIIQCKGMIKSIYLGVNCSDKDKLDMIKAIGDKDIPLYQMEIDDTNLTRLRKVQIG